ncbi:MAG: Ig-like domain-containing protein [Candidatus Thorarchaeota archaeon]
MLIIVILILALAGLTAWLLTRNRVQITPTTPSVFIQSPVAGSQVPINQPVTVNATASDPNSITRAELWVGGNVVDQQESAIPEGQPTFPVTLRWTPTVAGSYTLEIRAYNSLGVASAPTTVMITAVGESGEANTPTPTPPGGTATSTGQPTAVTTTDLNMREGPGQGYAVITLLPVNTQVEVTGKNADGSWWQIAFPAGSAERGWVFAAFTQSSNTENVPVVQAPPPPTPTQTPTVTPTATSAPTSTPTVTLTPTPTSTTPPGPIVEFGATRTTIDPGECTTLQWHIEFVTAAFLSGGEFSNYGITGPLGQIETCPGDTTTYLLRAETDSGTIERSVTVTVRAAQTNTRDHTSGGSVREDGDIFTPQPVAGDNDTDQALRAFFAFDVSDLSDAKIISARLDLSDYARNGSPFGELSPLYVEEVDWGSTLEGADYDVPAKANLATVNGSAGLDNSIDVTERVISRLDSGNNTFRIRLRFDKADNGDGSEDSLSWAGRTAQLILSYTN